MLIKDIEVDLETLDSILLEFQEYLNRIRKNFNSTNSLFIKNITNYTKGYIEEGDETAKGILDITRENIKQNIDNIKKFKIQLLDLEIEQVLDRGDMFEGWKNDIEPKIEEIEKKLPMVEIYFLKYGIKVNEYIKKQEKRGADVSDIKNKKELACVLNSFILNIFEFKHDPNVLNIFELGYTQNKVKSLQDLNRYLINIESSVSTTEEVLDKSYKLVTIGDLIVNQVYEDIVLSLVPNNKPVNNVLNLLKSISDKDIPNNYLFESVNRFKENISRFEKASELKGSAEFFSYHNFLEKYKNAIEDLNSKISESDEDILPRTQNKDIKRRLKDLEWIEDDLEQHSAWISSYVKGLRAYERKNSKQHNEQKIPQEIRRVQTQEFLVWYTYKGIKDVLKRLEESSIDINNLDILAITDYKRRTPSGFHGNRKIYLGASEIEEGMKCIYIDEKGPTKNVEKYIGYIKDFDEERYEELIKVYKQRHIPVMY